MGYLNLGLGWLPLFTSIWFYALFIPVYAYLYKWYGVGDILMVYTLSSSAIKDSPGSISVFGGYMGSIDVLFFVNKMIWLSIVKTRLGEKVLKPWMEYLFLIFSLLSALFMWLFTSFFYGGFPDLHNMSASLFFGFELLALSEVAIIDYRYTKTTKANNIIRLSVILIAVAAFFAIMLGSIMDTASDRRVDRAKETSYDKSNNDIYDNVLGTAEIIVILAGLTFYGTFVPMFSKADLKITLRDKLLESGSEKESNEKLSLKSKDSEDVSQEGTI